MTLGSLTKGWSAIGQLRYGEALVSSDAILTNTPLDANAIVLKGRALVGLDRTDEAIELLQKQMASQPSDTGSLQLLSRIYVRQNDWPKAAMIAQRLSELTPDNQANKLLLVEASLRSGNFALAREASANILKPDAQPTTIASVLDLWADFWPSSQRAQDALKFASQSPALNQKLVYAGFLNRINDPADSMRIASQAAGLPVNGGNAEADAVLADSWSRTGNVKGAMDRFNAVIAFDPGNATALRGRAELELRLGNAKSAVIDAQKLVTVLPSSARVAFYLPNLSLEQETVSGPIEPCGQLFKSSPAMRKSTTLSWQTSRGTPMSCMRFKRNSRDSATRVSTGGSFSAHGR